MRSEVFETPVFFEDPLSPEIIHDHDHDHEGDHDHHDHGQALQGVAALGDAVDFTYSYSNLFDGGIDRSGGFSEFEMLLAVEEGMSLWASVAPLHFVEVEDSGRAVSDRPYTRGTSADIRIGHHALSGNTLGHAFFPGGSGLDSDLHMDSGNRVWTESGFLSTMTHEIGHTIGLSHNELAPAIMNSALGSNNMLPGIGRGFLYLPDIRQVQGVYGEGVGSVTTFRSWDGSESNRWGTHDNWDRDWKPTQFSEVTLSDQAEVSLITRGQEAKNVSLGTGRNELKISQSGVLEVTNDVRLGTSQGIGNLLVDSNNDARTLVPDDASNEGTWFETSFDDRTWQRGGLAVGYDRESDFNSLIGTDVGNRMFDQNGSVYTRIEFDVADPQTFDLLSLRMKYDDGFVAYLNGTQVASANSPSTPRWNSTATDSRNDSLVLNFSEFDLSTHTSLLQAGKNVLAIQGMNQRTSSSDLLLLPELSGGSVDNRLVVESGQVSIGRDLILSDFEKAKTELILSDGRIDVKGRVEAGPGDTTITMSGGVLNVQGVQEGIPLVMPSNDTRYLVPRNDDLAATWTQSEFDASTWNEGTAAIGFERGDGFDSLIATDIDDEMFGRETSVYIRIPFEVADDADFNQLTLRMMYDDGFAAYLNGKKVASANAPEILNANSQANGSVDDDDATQFIDFDLSPFIADLRDGQNVLAIHGMNRSVTSSDMLIRPELLSGSINGVLEVGTLDFSGGTILGVTTFRADFRHTAGEFSPTGSSEQDHVHQISIEGAYRMTADSTLVIDVSRTEFDAITVSNEAVVAGNLGLHVGDDSMPSERGESRRMTFLTADSLSGEFSSIQLNDAELQAGHQGDGLFQQVEYTDGSVSFFTYLAIPGDANGDGEFNSSDLVTVFRAGEFLDDLEGNSNWTEGDWNGDMEFDTGDFVVAFQAGFFETGSVLEAATVPEPTSSLLLAIVGVGLFFIQRRRCVSSGQRA